MASPYTQDITQSEVFQKITGKKKQKPIDEFLGGLAELKALGQSNIAENMQELQESNTFEMQSAKNQLNH